MQICLGEYARVIYRGFNPTTRLTSSIVVAATSLALSLPLFATSLKYPSSLLIRSYSPLIGSIFFTTLSATSSFNLPIPHPCSLAICANCSGDLCPSSSADQIKSRFDSPGREVGE